MRRDSGGFDMDSLDTHAVSSRRTRGSLRRLVTALIATAALLLGSAAIAPAAGATTSAMAQRQTSFDNQMIAYVNQARAAAGVGPVREASGLTIMSAWWSAAMSNGATGGNLQHNPNAWTQVLAYGASNRRAWGENVAKLPTGTSAKALFDAYMASPSHKANILSSKYHYIGMGTVGDASWQYNTMEFTDQVESRTIVATQRKPVAKKTVAKPVVKAVVAVKR